MRSSSVESFHTLSNLPGLFLLTLLGSCPAYAQSTFGCGAVGSNSNVNYNLHQPVSETLNNSCAATTAIRRARLSLWAGVLLRVPLRDEANGDLHEHWTSHYNLTGQDANGIKYVGKDEQHYDYKLDPDGTFPPCQPLISGPPTVKLKAQGPTPDLTITQKLPRQSGRQQQRYDRLGKVSRSPSASSRNALGGLLFAMERRAGSCVIDYRIARRGCVKSSV